MKSMRQPTLDTLGLGNVLEIFSNARLPAQKHNLVDKIFGPADNRGSLVISGINGTVGAGKAMQLSSRLLLHNVRIVGLDFPNVPDGLGREFPGLVRAFGPEHASHVRANIIPLTYNGIMLPTDLKRFNPRLVIEAIPEILEQKRSHYKLLRTAFPDMQIRSVTSGFPSSELGVPIAHPSFPHASNKVWEIVEREPSAFTHLLWSLGLIPVPVSDCWSFVLDVLFCGLTLTALKYHRHSNMPYWKEDKYVRKLLGPNPFRAHDAIGSVSSFLTWSCLHHLSEQYGELFMPTPDLAEKKDSKQPWYPPDHSRPAVDWALNGVEQEDLRLRILGPLFQMTSLMLHENRAHLSHINAIGELCAQFRTGILAVIRKFGLDTAIELVEKYHELNTGAAKSPWYPDAFSVLDEKGGQQLYVNAEHDGTVGVITISRESYNWDVDAELNRAIDWLRSEGINNVILTHNFHLAGQLVGADISEFFHALDDVTEGIRISERWTRTACRLENDFATSVGFIGGKRCLGGMLELFMHCHYLIAVDEAELGMPEVTLPVVPGMDGCHLPFRKSHRNHWPKILDMLLTGKLVKARDAVNWLVDYAGPMEKALSTAWTLAHANSDVPRRNLVVERLSNLPERISLPPADQRTEAARHAIIRSVRMSCATTLYNAHAVQAGQSANFMTKHCKEGRIGQERNRIMSA